MKSSGKVWLLVAVALIAGVVVGTQLNRPAFGDGPAPRGSGMPHYTVVQTEGTNLIVTDNQKDVVYFYTIAEDGKPGDDLILRGSGDLSQVGSKVFKPTLINLKKTPPKKPSRE